MTKSVKPSEEVLNHINEYYSYDAINGKLYRKLKNSYKEIHNISAKGYRRAQILRNSYQLHNVCWYLYYKEWPNLVIDHIDRNPLNNKITNLRLVTESMQNLNRKTASKLGKYIYFWAYSYHVVIKKKYFGSFSTLEEAIKIRDENA